MVNQERSKVKQAKNIDKETIFAAQTEKVEMSLNTESALAQGLLIQRLTELYEDPVEATVRETISNGIDAVSCSHSGERPEVKVYKPTNLNPTLVIKDNGIGMTYEDLKNVYSKYGASTKAEDLNQIGAYGLGAKAPLSYGNEFTVTSIKDGQKTTIIVVREEMTNYIKIVNAEETDEETGTTVSIPLSNSDVERFKTNVEKYREIPLDKDVDLYINDELVTTDEYALLSENVVTYSGEEEVTGRVWVKKDKVVQLLSTVDTDYLKKSLKYVIGGWKYDAPVGRDNYYRSLTDYGIVVELKAGIVGFNSARDAILANDRYTDLEKLMVDYISSDDFVKDVTKMVNTLDLDNFKKVLSDLLRQNPSIKIEDGKIVVDNLNKHSYNSQIKRKFSLSDFVHNETGFNLNYIIKNVPKKEKKAVVFKESKTRHYKSVSNYLMGNENSYSHMRFEDSNVSKINEFAEYVFTNVVDGNDLGDLMIHLSTFIFNKREAKDTSLTFVTDIKDESEVRKLKAARKSIVKLSIEGFSEDKYDSIVVYTENSKKEIDKMLNGLGFDEAVKLKVSTVTNILKEVKEFRSKNKTAKKSKSNTLETVLNKFDNNEYKSAEISDLDEDKINLIIVSKDSQGYYNSTRNATRLKQMIAWFCNENEISEDKVDVYTSRGMHTASDVKILNETNAHIFRDPHSQNAGLSKAYYKTIHKNVAELHAFNSSELTNEDEAVVRILTGLITGPAERVSRTLERVLSEAYSIAGIAGRTMPTFPGKRLEEIKEYDKHTFDNMGYYDRWVLNDSAINHLAKRISEDNLELVNNIADLTGSDAVKKNSEGKFVSIYNVDQTHSYSSSTINKAFNDKDSMTKQKVNLVKLSTESYLDYIEDVVKALDKFPFKKA